MCEQKSFPQRYNLYGSRARETARKDSDWDIVILLNKDHITLDIERNITYPLYDLEFDSGKVISPMIYSKKEIEVSSHAGVRQQFGQFFVKTGKVDRDLGKHYTELFEKRHKGGYNDFYDYNEETVLKLYPFSRLFVEKIETILKQL